MSIATTPRPDIDLDVLKRFGNQYTELRNQLNGVFQEREPLIEQLLYALLTQEHVLIWGVPGTAKTLVITTLVECFEGSVYAGVQLSRYMTEAGLTGMMPSLKALQEGRYDYTTKGTILEANVVELDEVGNASPDLLNTLLGPMSVRQLKRGPTILTVNWHTVIGSTTEDPDALRKRGLAAFLDRFLFWSHVNGVEDPERRIKMYQSFLEGVKPTVRIPFPLLKQVSDWVVSANQYDFDAGGMQILWAYEKILQELRNALSEQSILLTDRRACKALQLTEAAALLDGRVKILPEDLLATRWALCQGGKPDEYETFMGIAAPIVESLRDELAPDVDELTEKLLTEYQVSLKNLLVQDPSSMTADQLVEYLRDLIALKESKIAKIRPQVETVRRKKSEMVEALEDRIAQVYTTMRGEDAAH